MKNLSAIPLTLPNNSFKLKHIFHQKTYNLSKNYLFADHAVLLVYVTNTYSTYSMHFLNSNRSQNIQMVYL